MEADYLLIFSTCPDKATADSIAQALINAKLAACVQISQPIVSVYYWDNQVCQSQEVQLQIKCRALHYQAIEQLQIKCRALHYQAIEQLVIQLHPYEVPELIATPITHGLAPYLTWIKETTQS
jgi:periplasmic divalent cation tolerance protein